MAKRKRDLISLDMRDRLLRNRTGRLTVAQWMDMITAPFFWLVLLLALALPVFGPRLVLLLRAWYVIIPVFVLLFVVPLILRARRYARQPLQYGRFFAGVNLAPRWAFWLPETFYTSNDAPVRFKRRLAPRIPLNVDREYMVYYLEEPTGKTLLSIAPADHEDAEQFEPTKQFHLRYERRTGIR